MRICGSYSRLSYNFYLSSDILDETSREGIPPLDITATLQRSGPSVVKTRNGSVLSRGFILKTDHYPSGTLIIVTPWLIILGKKKVVRLILTSTYMGHQTSAHPGLVGSMYLGPLNPERKDCVPSFQF